MLADAVVIIGISVMMGALYHQLVYGGFGPLRSFVGIGAIAAGVFVLPGIFRGEYDLTHYLVFRPHLRRAFNYWNVTFVVILALAFLTRVTEDYSRGSMVLFYFAGLPAVLVMRYGLVSTVVLGSKVGLVAAQRVFLIGSGEDISRIRAALSAVEFRASHGGRRAADTARTRLPRSTNGGRRLKPTCARRSTARAHCVPMRSMS